jgi:hypothetical protein
VARTYWRWRLTWNPFGVYKAASSAVGLYQMTDAAYAEASRYCVRRHAVVDADCWFNSLYIRTMPSHAIELAAVYLDRSVAAVLAYAREMTASPQEKQDLAAFIHLCGAGPARGFIRRGFQVRRIRPNLTHHALGSLSHGISQPDTARSEHRIGSAPFRQRRSSLRQISVPGRGL